jgi:ribose transport system substrate-binding protein
MPLSINRKLLKHTMGAMALATGLAVTPVIAGNVPEYATVESTGPAESAKRIAFLTFQNNPFWNFVREGATAGTDYLAPMNTTVDYIVMGDDLTVESVVAGIESAVVRGYDGIVVVPIFDGAGPAIDAAAGAGVPVISIIAKGSVDDKALAFIGSNATKAGEQSGAFIADKLGGKGKVGVITGYFGATQHDQRMNGMIDYIKANHPGIEIVGPMENRDQAEAAYSITTDFMTANPDLNLVYVTAGGPHGAAKAIEDLDLVGKVGVFGYGHFPPLPDYLESGSMVGLLDQAPKTQAFDSVVRMHNYLVTGKAPEASVLEVDGTILTKDGFIN